MTSLKNYVENAKIVQRMWDEDEKLMEQMNDEIDAILDKYYDKLNIKDNEENFFLKFYAGLEENRAILEEWEKENKADDDEIDEFQQDVSDDYRQRYKDLMG